MSNGGRIIWLLLVISAGCSTVPRQQPPEAADVPDQNVAIATAKPPTNLPAATTNLAAAPKVASNAAPAAVAPSNQFNLNETWIPLERWSQACGYGAPRRIATDTALVYSFAPTNGGMAIKIGSQSAWWDGLEYRLGFAPELIDGHPFVRSLDVRKNFIPLLDSPFQCQTNRVLVIDPGHGGSDVGTRSVLDGRYEKEFTLDWARRLQALLITNGWSVSLTRSNDVNMPLPARVAFAESRKAALFLSLHFNSSYPDREQAGLETYCLTPPGMPSNLTRGFKDDAALTYPNNNFDTENLQVAIRFQRALLQVNGHLDRGVRRARFLGVLQGQNRPAVLIEGGYLSNPDEAREIEDGAYREKLAAAVAKALVEDFGGPASLASKAPTVPPAATNVDEKTN
jgi:N-acetylmuramoyl-L-alanine amidase